VKPNVSTSSLLIRITVAVLAFAVATAVTLLLWNAVFHRVPFALYFAAVAFAAWRSGWVAGMGVALAGVLTIAIHEEFPLNLLAPSLVLLGVSIAISVLATTRERALGALRESEARLTAILDNTPAMVYVVDTQNRFQFINRRWQPVFGLSTEQVVGHSVYDFFPKDVADQFAANNRKVLETRAPVEAEEVVSQKGGQRTYISVKVPLLDADGKAYAICGISADITERKRAEVRNRLLVALDDAMRSLTDASEVTARGARLLGEHLGADRCAYADVEADEDTFNLTGDYNRGVPSIVGRYRFADFGAEVLRLMRADEPYVVEDIDTHQPPVGDLTYYRQTMIRSVICVPLHKAGRFVAAMAVHQKVPRRWTPEEVDLVRHVAARCWESIERTRVERTLRESERHFRQLADAMPQMVWVTRPDGYHEFYNRRWYEFTGVPDGSTDGEGWNGMFHPDDQDRAWAAWRHSLASGEPYEIEYRLRHRSGEYRWTLGRALPVRDAGGLITRWFGTCTDIDALKRLQQERESLLESERLTRAEAERASEAKSEFLATLSHELRTPLTPVLLTVSLMESNPALTPELREDVATIRRNVELESRLISDLLDLTRITKGKLQLDEREADLHLIVRSAVDICQREASAKLTLDLRAARHTVQGDSTRLQQVFWNLINNAIKFTPEDGMITVESRNIGHDRVLVEVRDTGAGIDPEVIPKLFDAFEQGEVRAARQQAGLGLGLTISRKLVEAHGGTIIATSPGRGSGASFTVNLPVVEQLVRPSQAVQPSPALVPRAARSLNVLLVEDHEPTLRVMERLLRQIGHRVTGVTTVASATAAAAQDGFDLIISDLGLPDGSGLDVMRQLRDRYSGRAIALTGYGMESDVTASRDAGFAEHLTKPVDLAALDAAIRRVSSSGD